MLRTERKLKFLFVSLGIIVLIPFLFPGDPYTQRYTHRLQAPSRAHLFGTDEFGRDMIARVFQGMRVSLLVSFFSCSVALVLGSIFGMFVLFSSVRLQWILRFIPTMIMAFPPILLALCLVSLWIPGVLTLGITLTIVFIPVFIQLVDNEGNMLMGNTYINAAKTFGISRFSLVSWHLLPALRIPLLAQWSSVMLIAIQIEAALSFIGLGVQPPVASWGTLLLYSRRYFIQAPWIAIMPAASLCVVSLLFFMLTRLLGKGIRLT